MKKWDEVVEIVRENLLDDLFELDFVNKRMSLRKIQTILEELILFIP